ncbi:hypothetical protein FA13DRAFT_1718179 [Coprinellus micaceus]|uniref:Uncharacterized protein n=1 Tax=Coprinellus micaceus TaxID=71717 RepID=A0A4Y7SEM0_COPMI|nr:hypothetical protein FA13DRAFT_1718179 [Coprinellus micaceus]
MHYNVFTRCPRFAPGCDLPKLRSTEGERGDEEMGNTAILGTIDLKRRKYNSRHLVVELYKQRREAILGSPPTSGRASRSVDLGIFSERGDGGPYACPDLFSIEILPIVGSVLPERAELAYLVYMAGSLIHWRDLENAPPEVTYPGESLRMCPIPWYLATE